jgi:hypothetical protein
MGEHEADWKVEDTNTDKNLPLEEAFFEVILVCHLPLPEKAQ